MKKTFLRVMAVIMAVMMLASTGAFLSFAADDTNAKLTFKDDGTFTILHYCDFQHGPVISKFAKDFIRDTVNAENPDLIVLGGDNISGGSNGTKVLVMAAIDQFMSVFEELGVPVVIVFGNHDDEGGMTKDEMLKVYQKYDCFIGYDADPNLYGCGTSNYPIYDAAGENIIFNVYAVDSNTYLADESIGGYDYVHEDQVAWYKNTRDALKAETGNYVPSFAFQHIIVPQIYDVIIKNDASAGGYDLPEGAEGFIGEGPCPPNTSVPQGYLEFDAMAEKGDVLGMFFGHDHVNAFDVECEGIRLVNTTTSGFGSYGDENRGCRVITLDAENLDDFDTELIRYVDFYADDEVKLSAFEYNNSRDFFDQLVAFFKYVWTAFISIFA